MGEIEINSNNHTITISSHIITYGNEATEEVTERMRKEIETIESATQWKFNGVTSVRPIKISRIKK